jgi:hypothetical protein
MPWSKAQRCDRYGWLLPKPQATSPAKTRLCNQLAEEQVQLQLERPTTLNDSSIRTSPLSF